MTRWEFTSRTGHLSASRAAPSAEALIAGDGTISVQVLNEYANVARRKTRPSWAQIAQLPQTIQRVAGRVSGHRRRQRDRTTIGGALRLSVFDAMIVAAALAAGCGTLWSEDMRHGRVLDGRVRIANPFTGA